MNKVVEKPATESKPEQTPSKVEEASVEEVVAEEELAPQPAPQPVDPFLGRKAARLAAVQLQVDGPKPLPVTSDVTEDESEKDE